MKFKQIEWSENKAPNDSVRYDHVVGTTPFGEFLITWKGWKTHDNPSIDETPWGDFGGVGNDIDDAKIIAEAEYLRRLDDCVAT